MSINRFSTGIDGLDEILDGGLVEEYNVLLRGPPGAGKTIFGLHFLAAGIEKGETSLFVNLGEPNEYVKDMAEYFDLHSDDIHFKDLAPTAEMFSDAETYSLFESAEVEQPSFIEELRSVVEKLDPDRVLLDPITEFRYLTTDEYQFRTQILGFLDFLKQQGATVLLTSQASDDVSDDDLQFLTDAVINLEIGFEGRAVHISKLRGSSYQRGRHSYEISDSGVTVWPKLVSQARQVEITPEKMSSGVPELDEMLDGGLDTGTVTFFSGPTGAGKTTTGLQFVKEAAGQGVQSVVYSFEESRDTLLARAKALNIPLVNMVDQGVAEVLEIRPDQYTVDEFTARLREDVEEKEAKVVMLDGIQGFKQNLRGMGSDTGKVLIRIGRYLRSRGVLTIVTNEVHNITGEFVATEEQTSNLADNIIFLRHVEYKGELRKVIGVLKMRQSDFERTLRELEITEHGLRVGEPLPDVRGILTGTPEWTDSSSDPGE